MAVAVFLGFVINVILGFFIPYNELIGGAVAGYIAGGSLGRAVLAGFLAGIIGGFRNWAIPPQRLWARGLAPTSFISNALKRDSADCWAGKQVRSCSSASKLRLA